MKRSKDTNAAIAAIAYADIFDFPLTRNEVRYWAVGAMRAAPRVMKHVETRHRGEDIYLYVRGRERLVSLRRTRGRIAANKWRKAERIAGYFRVVPTMLLVGVTGGLAMDNAAARDDIDLFFIARPGTLWVTRALVTLIAEGLGVRRRPSDHRVSDKVCLNMFMTEDALALPSGERDLFAAHEVLQLRPLWEREGAYGTFLKRNAWVGTFLPQAWDAKKRTMTVNCRRRELTGLLAVLSFPFLVLEPIGKLLQLWYMRKKRTHEVIRRGQIRFHPRDAREWVREKYAQRLTLWDIPLDNVFYHR